MDFSFEYDPDQDATVVYDDDGNVFYCGLQVPKERSTLLPRLFDSDLELPRTKAEIKEWVTDPRRTPSAEFFPGDVFIKSQGGRGSCNGYACAKALEKSRVLLGMEHIALSGEGVYAQINGGRDRGSMLNDGMKCLMESGAPPESMVPHETYIWSRVSDEAKQSMGEFQARECYRIDDEMELAAANAADFVCVVGIHAGGSFSRIGSDGVLGYANGGGNHSVQVDDVRVVDGELQFRMANSWGTRFGKDGAGWTTWAKHYRQTIRNHAFFAIRGAKRA